MKSDDPKLVDRKGVKADTHYVMQPVWQLKVGEASSAR